MIIKKKRNQDKKQEQPIVELVHEEVQLEDEIVEKTPDDDILNQFDIDNINFEQRAERRQGSRRRGYRRIDDRNLVSRAQEEAVSIKELAVKEGHKIGIESAKEDIAKLNSSIEEFFSYKDKVYSEISSGILDISIEVAKKIINTELTTNNEAIMGIISGALDNNLKGENRITIKVMPEEVAVVKENLPEFLAKNQYEVKINVVPDESIELGGAIIETGNGIIDATIKTQLEIIKEAFKKI